MTSKLLFSISMSSILYSCAIQKVSGYIFINKNYSPCTLVECACCNECSGQINAIIGNDTVLITGKPHGQKIECNGSDCDLKNSSMKCTPFEMNKRYELKGSFEYSGKDNSIKVFRVVNYK